VAGQAGAAMRDETAGLGPRRAALHAVAELLGGRRSGALDDLLAIHGTRERLDPRDAALARAIAVATFRHLGALRASLGRRLNEGLPEDQPRLLALLATGAAQIVHLNVPDHAAVDLSVRLAREADDLARLGGLVNAVLRRVVRERDAVRAEGEADPIRAGAPGWLAARWEAAYGAETARGIGAGHLAGAALDLTPRTDAETWAGRLGATLLPTGTLRLDARTPVPDLPGYAEGAWWVQDAAAALPARLLAVAVGERVADLCAAPGGKTAQLAAAGAVVTAVDRSSVRLKRLSDNLERLGLAAEIVTADALALPDDEPFDAVLLDAPCTATGTLRRHPDVAWTKSPGDLARLADLQARLLDKAARLVRPGGRLVYCVCSLEPEEGEAQVPGFLARNPDYAPAPIRADEVGGRSELLRPDGTLRSLPAHLGAFGGLDGFFAARFTRG
jgi:16S rRNA (cytosine967-C5)-methyltransferase